MACPLGGSCNDVLNSPYATLLGEEGWALNLVLVGEGWILAHCG